MMTLEFAQALLMMMALFCPGSMILLLMGIFIVVRQAGWLQKTETLKFESVDESVLPVIETLIKEGWEVGTSARSEQVGLYTIIMVKKGQRVIG